jgi:copper resistance protein B
MVIKVDAEQVKNDLEELELQARYSRAISPYWDFQVGVRQDQKPKPVRNWLAIGFSGLAPYFFEVDSTLFVGESNRLGFRLKAEYEAMLTQRWVLSPEMELNLYSKDDAATGVGSGLSNTRFGLRLRYEIRREFAPYIGVTWNKLYGNTADFAKAAGGSVESSQIVAGIRAWF